VGHPVLSGKNKLFGSGIGPRSCEVSNQIFLLIDPDERIIDIEHDLAINQERLDFTGIDVLTRQLSGQR